MYYSWIPAHMGDMAELQDTAVKQINVTVLGLAAVALGIYAGWRVAKTLRA